MVGYNPTLGCFYLIDTEIFMNLSCRDLDKTRSYIPFGDWEMFQFCLRFLPCEEHEKYYLIVLLYILQRV